MSAKALPCSCCGYLLTFEEDVPVVVCPACSTRNAEPRASGDMLLTLQRAVEQRLACDFHDAEMSYQQVLLYHPDEHEALWGRLLCHYGVEYVEDPATRRRMPTVRTIRPRPMQEQQDFRKACDFAPAAVRAQYEQDARYIDDAQAEIRQKARSCQPYDVFLCHKTTRPGSSDYTQDFHHATQLYHFLKDQGVRVFFAPECLQSAAGANYEAGIYHALQTAKVMLLVCSQADYLTSAWVRSEWTRFIDLMDEDPARQIVPLLYDHFSPSNLPQPFIFRRTQGLDMTDINAPQALLALVSGAVGRKDMGQTAAPATGRGRTAPQADAPKGGSAKPAPRAKAAPVESSRFITLKFPDPLPEWDSMAPTKIKWNQYRLYKQGSRTPLSEMKWGKTVQVPAADGETLIIARKSVFGTICRVLIDIFLLWLAIGFVSMWGLVFENIAYLPLPILMWILWGFCVVFVKNHLYYETKVHITSGDSYNILWNERHTKFIVN